MTFMGPFYSSMVSRPCKARVCSIDLTDVLLAHSRNSSALTDVPLAHSSDSSDLTDVTLAHSSDNSDLTDVPLHSGPLLDFREGTQEDPSKLPGV